MKKWKMLMVVVFVLGLGVFYGCKSSDADQAKAAPPNSPMKPGRQYISWCHVKGLTVKKYKDKDILHP